MTLKEQQNRLFSNCSEYLTLNEAEQEAFWQRVRTEVSEASEPDRQLLRQAVAANLEQIKKRLLDIKRQLETTENPLLNE